MYTYFYVSTPETPNNVRECFERLLFTLDTVSVKGTTIDQEGNRWFKFTVNNESTATVIDIARVCNVAPILTKEEGEMRLGA